jgi:putative flippase GtrA
MSGPSPRPKRPLVRYALVGLASNLAGYLLYLAATAAGLGPKTAMTLLYLAGAGAGFFGNRRWSFAHQGRPGPALLRYAAAHAVGYGANLALLTVFSDQLGFPHQWVQGAAIFVVAGILFLLFRSWVFPPERGAA